MLADEEILWHVERATYKPGWRIEASRAQDRLGIVVHISYEAPNADGGRQAAVYSRFVLSPIIPNLGSLKAIIYDSIRAMELHELDEWLRFDRVRYREPHPEKET